MLEIKQKLLHMRAKLLPGRTW